MSNTRLTIYKEFMINCSCVDAHLEKYLYVGFLKAYSFSSRESFVRLCKLLFYRGKFNSYNCIQSISDKILSILLIRSKISPYSYDLHFDILENFNGPLINNTDGRLDVIISRFRGFQIRLYLRVWGTPGVITW